MFNSMKTVEDVARDITSFAPYVISTKIIEKNNGKRYEGTWVEIGDGHLAYRRTPTPRSYSSVKSAMKRVRCKGGQLWCFDVSEDHYLNQVEPLLAEYDNLVVATIQARMPDYFTQYFVIVSARGRDAVAFKMNYVGQDKTPV